MAITPYDRVGPWIVAVKGDVPMFPTGFPRVHARNWVNARDLAEALPQFVGMPRDSLELTRETPELALRDGPRDCIPPLLDPRCPWPPPGWRELTPAESATPEPATAAAEEEE